MLDILSEYWALLCLVSVVLVVLWIAAVISKYVRLMLNIFRDTPPPLHVLGLHHSQKLEGRLVRFRAFDGTLLRGMFLSPAMLEEEDGRLTLNRKAAILESASKGVIVFCHEYGSNMYSWSRYCLGLLQAGYDIFAFDFRSHGKSVSLPNYTPRLWCTNHEVSDCLGALAYVHGQMQKHRLQAGIGFFGISRGACASILTAGSPFADGLVRAVLSDSGFSNDITLEALMKRWVHIFAKVRFVYENHPPIFWRFLRWVLLQVARRKFHCRFPSVRKTLNRLTDTPTFFIHGLRDSYIRPEQTRKLFEHARRPRYLWMVPGAKHNQSAMVQPEVYHARAAAFFDKYVYGGDAADQIENPLARMFRAEEHCDNLVLEEERVAAYEKKQVVQQKMAETGSGRGRTGRRPRRPGTAKSFSEKSSPMPPEPK